MNRPIAYITASWGSDDVENTEQAAEYCRTVYEAGYSPVCPILFLPLFLHDEIPLEHKDAVDMARDHLRRARVLVVVSGRKTTEQMKSDIAIAERLHITATSLRGIEDVMLLGRGQHA
jgi:hypothetical protein